MSWDQLEFAISQYADGTLPARERASLEQVLRSDESARALLDEYRALEEALAGARGGPRIRMDWDRLAGEISGAVATMAGRSDGEAAVPEEVEFAVACYADGTLPEADHPAVEARLARDPAARLLLNDYHSVDALVEAVKTIPLPEVRWEALAARLSDAVADVARQGNGAELPEDVEFAIAQYADGTLPEDQLEAVEAKLAGDPAARLLLAEYAQVDSALKAASLPAVRWERFAEELSLAVAEAAEGEAEHESAARPARSYKLFAWARRPTWLAAAASVLLAVGIGVRVLNPPAVPPTHDGVIQPPPPLPPPSFARVDVLGAEAPASPAAKPVAEISIGPAPALARMPGGTMEYVDDLASRPSRTIIASGAPASREGGFLPY